MQRKPPRLPDAFVSAYVTYWLPMDERKFVSSGTVWFDYKQQCYRIDGLFNPWDVLGTQSQLWMTELAHYGAGITYRMSLLYDRIADPGRSDVRDAHWLDSRKLAVDRVPVREAIIPQDYLQEVNAVCVASESRLGIQTDVWRLPPDNRLGIRTLHLRADGNELVRMEQEKHGQVLVRDFPNFVSRAVDFEIFAPAHHEFARFAGGRFPGSH